VSQTLGAYDLAEWVSLVLPTRPLTTMLLLRLLPLCLAMITGLLLGRGRYSAQWWLALTLIGITAVALLPPFEFIVQRDDVNYRQQFLLSVATLLSGIFILTRWVDRLRVPAVLLLCIVSIAVTVAGVTQAQSYMRDLGLPAQIGFGALTFVLALAGLSLLTLQNWRANRA
jgi:hypothetical protein